jgi:uncharacterized protein YjiS (DUF1127 family)
VKYLIKLIRFTYTPQITYSQYPLTKRVNLSLILIGAIMTTLSRNYSDCIESGSIGTQVGLYQQIRRWFKIIVLKLKVSRERQQLLEMSDAMLADLGITQANAEAQRNDLPVERLNALGKGTC